RHPDYGDRCMDTGQRPDAGNPAAGADDDAAVDLLAEDRVRAADVARAFGRDGGRLDAVAKLAERLGGVEHTLVARLAPLHEGEIEVAGLDIDSKDARFEQAERLPEKLLPRLVAM